MGIYWYQYFYNTTNAMDVVYKGEKPMFKEFGPYTYREFDNYEDLDYSPLDNIVGREELPAVYNNFTQGITFETGGDGDGHLDT